jgi:hypothetical protein
MPTGTIATVMSVDGSALGAEPVTETGDHVNNYDISLPAGLAGRLTTRTGDGQGVITMAATGHGIAGSDLVDVYWTGGARYAVTIDSIGGSGNVELTFDDTPAATGDVLPADETAVIVCERISINTAIDGDNVKMIGLSCTQRAQITFYDATPAIIKQYEFEVANAHHSWYSTSGVTNPITGNPIATAKASNGSTTAATLKIRCLDDSTP